MKKLLGFAILAAVVFGGGQVWAQPAPAAPADNAAAVNQDVKVVNVNNKICPISGHKIGEMGEGKMIGYNGKMYSLCCSMCEKDFMKDPAKFSKIADDEVAAEAAKQ